MGAKTKILRWQAFRDRLRSPDAAFLLSRVRLPQASVKSPGYHCHDFAEVFWVAGGKGNHRTSRGEFPLRVGEMFALRPEQAHAVSGSARDPIQLVNLAFPAENLTLIERYFSPVASHLWDATSNPRGHRLSASLLEWLGEESRKLAGGAHDRAALFHFLFGLHERLQPDRELLTSAPEWLRRALAEFRHPEHFAGGVKRLAELAGRAPETVSRAVRKETGESAATLLNQLRMDHAAHELRLTDRTILDIVFECGFQGTSQFYRRFRQTFEMSPAAYRKQFSRIA